MLARTGVILSAGALVAVAPGPDAQGDLDVDRHRRDTAGKDTVKFRATRANGSASCSARNTVA